MGFIKFIGARLFEATICFILITVLPLPPYMEFTAYSVPPYMPFEGPLQLNDRLNNAEHLFVDLLKGPEAFAVHNGEIYTGIHGGEVVKIVNNSLVHVAKFGKPCGGYWEESICGRPLGLKFDKHGNLYVADTYYGLFKVNIETGLVTKLVSADIPINGKKPLLINSVDVARDGTVYWSHSSSDVTLQDGVYTLLGDGSGRLLKYSPTTNTSEVLLEKLHFANGVLLSDDEDFVLVSETLSSQIRRYYLKGEKKGSNDVFVDKLPGLPDNLSHDGKGSYFVALAFPADKDHPAFNHIISEYPVLRKFLARLLALLEMPFQFIERFYPNYYVKRATHWIGHFESVRFMEPKRFTLLRLGKDGKVLESMHCLDGTLSGISDVVEFEDALYFGSPYNTYIGRIKLEKQPRISIRIKTNKEPTAEMKY
ncbi:adipocyte plasma membrane-associated protein Hemomucin-like [Schistocerca cancellata]|uniref:adipocyte plasma membrane-associated protein Hemomucin-like n=1 Tax=Schistocerca cancellata TaxID=274614 RepID=UPI002119565D|nr:adipocyte plasma membrane-associated protein Hemomucin-like [Schistocerca cancellata]XP_049776722.1 adipocyte plasma membrane-associated protein Hemomucin-like [Schistocerca cancellata]